MIFCRHIKASGHRCQAPALRDAALCYFHTQFHKRHRSLRKQAETAPRTTPIAAEQPKPFELILPPIEDTESLHVALTLIAQALALNLLEPARARALLYALQLIGGNVGRVYYESASAVLDIVRTKTGVTLSS